MISLLFEYFVSVHMEAWNKDLFNFFTLIKLSLSLSLCVCAAPVKLGNKEFGNGSNVTGTLVFYNFVVCSFNFFDKGIY